MSCFVSSCFEIRSYNVILDSMFYEDQEDLELTKMGCPCLQRSGIKGVCSVGPLAGSQHANTFSCSLYGLVPLGDREFRVVGLPMGYRHEDRAW